MTYYAFSLDNSRPNKLFYCPNCRRKSLKRYVNQAKNEYLDLAVGRCNRQEKCGYHYSPKNYFQDNPNKQNEKPRFYEKREPKAAEPSYHPREWVQASAKNFDHNSLVLYLRSILKEDEVNTLIQKYRLGTAKHWQGASVFWQIDAQQRVHGGKIMAYNPTNGKRIKSPKNLIGWAHILRKVPNFSIFQCYFGSHLLPDYGQDKPLILVESEKTALILSAYFPEYLFSATGGSQNLSPKFYAALGQQKVIAYPDVGVYKEWEGTARILRTMCQANIIVSPLLEQLANGQEDTKGWDLIDFLHPETLQNGFETNLAVLETFSKDIETHKTV